VPRLFDLVRRFRWWVLVPVLTVVSWLISTGLLHALSAGDAKWDVWRHRAGNPWSWTPFIHPPGYGEFLRTVQNIAASRGTTEIEIALWVAAGCTALLVPLVARGTAIELGKSEWIVGAAALVAISPSFLRPFENYPLASVLTTAAIVAMAAYARSGGVLRWLAIPVLVMLSVELHLNAWFLLGPAMAMLLIFSTGRRWGFALAIALTVGLFLYSTVAPAPGMWGLFDHPHAYFQGSRRFGVFSWSDPNLEWTNPLLFAPLILFLVPAVARRCPRGLGLALALAFYAVITTVLMASGLAIASNRVEAHHYYELIDPALTIVGIWGLATARRVALDAGRHRLQRGLLVVAAVVFGWQAYLAVNGATFLRTVAHSPWMWQDFADTLRLGGGTNPLDGWIVVEIESQNADELLRQVGHIEVILSPKTALLDAEGQPLTEGLLYRSWSIEERMGDPEVLDLVLRRDTGGFIHEWPKAAIAPGLNVGAPFSMQVLGFDQIEGGKVVAVSDVISHLPDPTRKTAAVFMKMTRFESNGPTCGDGEDNDRDGWPDQQDPGCERGTEGREVDGLSTHPCNDGIDNDGDGAIDRADNGCNSGFDSEEL
jgi:hypothetical protein